jgi:NAD(P)-dependent dehydrogenase (short-subunit alcohol dehydrogenase family)
MSIDFAVEPERWRACCGRTAKTVSASTPLWGIGLPDDCAQAALFLCSDKANWVTGVDVLIDGGVLVWGAGITGGGGEGDQILTNLSDAAGLARRD